eukprot:m.268014 g.268014  ORF g.268014 m.268014 type:complete len:61 (-) comp34325_c0_seq1:176-358(-)
MLLVQLSGHLGRHERARLGDGRMATSRELLAEAWRRHPHSPDVRDPLLDIYRSWPAQWAP